MSENVTNLLEFIKNSPSPFHAVSNIEKILCEKGFQKLYEDEKWKLENGKSYFVTRNSSSIISFMLPKENIPSETSFRITASHSDSPVFKIKENPEIKSGGSVVLNVEKYGGMLLAPWFDRPLSVAGRVIVHEEKDGKTSLKEILVNVDRDLLLIPNLAIHMNREANEGRKIDVQNEIRPVLSMDENQTILGEICKSHGLKAEDVVSHDLFIYNRSPSSVWGAKKEFISSPKLDDLECAYTSLKGFLDSGCAESKNIRVHAVFDNEEVGSLTRQGADSTFLSDTLSRIAEKLLWESEDFKISLAKSMMLSCDNAHALHPNYLSSADPVNRPKINGGIVIKYNATQKYTTDAFSSAFFKEICKKAGVSFQIFTNNSNIAGGSTLGNISQSHLSLPCADIGLAQWAMHSPYETAGTRDADFMIKAVADFYQMC